MSEDQVKEATEEVAIEEEEKPLTIFDICETDTDAEENGRWFRDLFDDGTNVAVKLRRMTSKASIQARRRLDKQFRSKQNKRGEYDEDTGMEVVIAQIAEGVIADWDNIRGRDGKPLECTLENKKMLLTKLPTFRDAVIIYSNELDNYRIEAAEDAEKN